MDEIVAQDSELFYQFKTDVFENKNIKDIEIPDYDYGMKYAYIVTQIFSGLNPEKGKFIDLKGKYSSKFDAHTVSGGHTSYQSNSNPGYIFIQTTSLSKQIMISSKN